MEEWEAKNLDYKLDIYFTILNDSFIDVGKKILDGLLVDEKTVDANEKKSRNINRLYLEEVIV